MLCTKFQLFWTKNKDEVWFFVNFFLKIFLSKMTLTKIQIYPEIFFICLSFTISVALNQNLITWGSSLPNFRSLPLLFFDLWTIKVEFFLQNSWFSLIFFLIKNRKMSLSHFTFPAIKSKTFGIGRHVSPFWKEE